MLVPEDWADLGAAGFEAPIERETALPEELGGGSEMPTLAGFGAGGCCAAGSSSHDAGGGCCCAWPEG